MQGESDAANPYYAAAYQTNLTNLIAAVRSDFNTPDMPFVIGRIAPAWGYPEYNALVRAAQVTVPTLVNNASWINTDDLQISTAIPPHYGTQGQIDLGMRFANQFIQIPEPGSFIMLVLGLAAVCVSSRCRTIVLDGRMAASRQPHAYQHKPFRAQRPLGISRFS
jgi:hypothetical protein